MTKQRRKVVQIEIDWRPRLLDLYCCGGGAAAGYDRASFRVTGIDKAFQKRYPFRFIQADALEYLRAHWQEYDAVHASPPCQAFTALRHMPNARKHEDLIEPTRDALEATGLPYVIENVVGAPLLNPVQLCGTMFNLRTACGANLRRHRLFETNWPLEVTLQCNHFGKTLHVAGSNPWTGHLESKRRTICVNGTGLPLSGGRTISVVGDHPRDPSITYQNRTITVTGSTAQQNTESNRRRESFPVEAARTAMGIDWLTMKELSQAIPPAYTEYIGRQLLRIVEGR